MSTNNNGTQITVETADSKRLDELMETSTIQTAKRQPKQSKKASTPSKAKAEDESPSGVGDGLGKVTENLKTNIKRKIVSTAIYGAIAEIKAGDFGDLDALALDEINDAIDCEFDFLGEIVALPVLPPSSGSNLLLNGTPKES